MRRALPGGLSDVSVSDRARTVDLELALDPAVCAEEEGRKDRSLFSSSSSSDPGPVIVWKKYQY